MLRKIHFHVLKTLQHLLQTAKITHEKFEVYKTLAHLLELVQPISLSQLSFLYAVKEALFHWKSQFTPSFSIYQHF